MPKQTLKCKKCGESFPRDSIITYKEMHFCMKCYKEKIAQDNFITEVNTIFGIISPGPRIYRDRKILLEKGYTDNVILMTLRYIYGVKKLKPKSISLALVTPQMINEALKYNHTNLQKMQEELYAEPEQEIESVQQVYKENNVKFRHEQKEQEINVYEGYFD